MSRDRGARHPVQMQDHDPADPRLRRAVGLALAVGAALDALGFVLAPWLLVASPIALLAICPDDRHLALTARVDLVWVIAVALPRRLLGALATYGLGFAYGPPTTAWFERRIPPLAAALRWIEHRLDCAGPVLLMTLPGYTLSVLYGAGRRPLSTFLALSAVGQLVQIVLLHRLGTAIAEWTDLGLARLASHAIECTAVCAGLLLVQRGFAIARRRRQQRERCGNAA